MKSKDGGIRLSYRKGNQVRGQKYGGGGVREAKRRGSERQGRLGGEKEKEERRERI